MKTFLLAAAELILCSFLLSLFSVPLQAEMPDDFGLEKGPMTGALGEWAEVNVPMFYAYTGREGTQKMMKQMGNLLTNEELGMVVPTSAFDQDANADRWYAVFEFEESGYVKDDEKTSIDSAKLLEQMRESSVRENEMRVKQNLPRMDLEGWAVEPHYDEATHNLEWALRFSIDHGSGKSQVVNYQIRLLGREGVMRCVLVCEPDDLESKLPGLREILKGFRFKSGHSYAEFRQGDKIAKYGLIGLITGGTLMAAAKMGLLQKFWKLIVIAVLAAASFIKKLFGVKEKETPAPGKLPSSGYKPPVIPGTPDNPYGTGMPSASGPADEPFKSRWSDPVPPVRPKTGPEEPPRDPPSPPGPSGSV